MKVTGRRAALAAATAGAVRSHGGPGLAARLASLPALVRDTVAGRYDGVGRPTLLLWVLGLAYLVSPIDLLPEALLTLPGLADDALVAGALITSVLGATTAYAEWREAPPAAPTSAAPTFTSDTAAADRTGRRRRSHAVVAGEVLSSRTD